MFIVLRAKRIFLILCLTIFGIGGMLIASNRTLVPVFDSVSNQGSRHIFIIDPGHGGEDGGAVSQSGVAESGINLAIAQRTELLLRFLGQNTAMTRTDENAVYSAGAATLREKKRSDLQNRVEMINGYEDAILVSIHQNSMPAAPRVHGAQVFYNTAPSADLLAEQVQQSLNLYINTGNEKVKKQIEPTIYLMRQVACPAILVECGFLSNAAEADNLQDGRYQTKLAITIAAGVLNDTNDKIGATI